MLLSSQTRCLVCLFYLPSPLFQWEKTFEFLLKLRSGITPPDVVVKGRVLHPFALPAVSLSRWFFRYRYEVFAGPLVDPADDVKRK